MAHSIQVYHGRSEIFNDFDLMVLFIFLRDVGNPPAFAIERAFPEWENTLRNYGPGLIDLALDERTDAQLTRLGNELRSVRVRLSCSGNHIPAGFLQARNITPGMVFGDFPVPHLLDAAVRLESLIGANPDSVVAQFENS